MFDVRQQYRPVVTKTVAQGLFAPNSSGNFETEQSRCVVDQDRALRFFGQSEFIELGEPTIEWDERIVAAEHRLRVQSPTDLADDFSRQIFRRPPAQLDPHV